MKATPSNNERVRSLLPSFAHGSPTAAGDAHAEPPLEEWEGLQEEHSLGDRNAAGLADIEATLAILSHNVEPQDSRESESSSGVTAPAGPLAASRLWSSALTKLSVAAVLLLAVGTLAWYLKPELISVPAEEIAIEIPQTGSLQLSVVFEKSIAFEEQEALVREIGARVVGGPSAGGAYLIELSAYQNGADASDAVLERLASDPRIKTVSRAVSLP